MAFDLENSVQQGLNRDPVTNDWNVEAHNIEIVLSDRSGGTTFTVRDVDNVGVAEITSDGYLSILGNGEIHGGNLLIHDPSHHDTDMLTFRDAHDDDASIFMADGDPNGIIIGTKGSLALDHIDGYLWINVDDYTQWNRLTAAGDIGGFTLQQSYKFDTDGGDAVINTDSADGSVVIAGTESLWVTATGGIDLDTGFDMDGSGPFDVNITGGASIDADATSNFTVAGANLTLSTTTSGDVNVNASDDLDMDGTDVQISASNNLDMRAGNTFELDGYANSAVSVTGGELTLQTLTTGSVHIDGVDGISLDANGNNILPAVTCQDSLGDASHAFSEVWICNGAGIEVAIGGAGGSSTPNTTSGAYVVGTNSDNFYQTFGPTMTGDSVQAALEAIDGYLLTMAGDLNDLDKVTLQIAYDNDPDGGDAIITTNSNDGAVVIAGTEKLWVTATSGIDLDTGFDMDGAGPFDVDITGAVEIDSDAASHLNVTGADLTLSTTTSGDVNVVVPDGTGDFIVDDAGGSRYIRAITSNGELQLGDATTPVFVTVMDDMEVMGDLTVQGTTTTINTENLWVEDRLVRLNVGANSNFDGNVGIEAEVGSDGYVEFHWDDTQGRWEISIDRNTTPEAQTFRPLPYLAEDAATLDLSDTGDDGWPTAGPNPTAGASVVNTNLTNFPYTFGPDMTDDSVQAALEAIDGYFLQLTTEIDNANVTLQEAYKNDEDGGNATITTDSTDGSVVIAGTQKLQVTATGGIDLDTGFDMDGSGPFDVDITGAAEIDADATSHFTVAGANLTLSTTTSGDVNVTAAGDLDQDGVNVQIDATTNLDMRAGGAFALDGYADSNVSVTGGELVLETLTTGSVHIDGVDGISLDGNGSNILPATTCQDSLGDASHAFTELWLCNGAGIEVAIGGAGGSSAPNTTSGAYVVGTNSDNFYQTYGPLMTGNSVQAALEAIDGYLLTMAGELDEIDDVTLQVAYNNDPDGGDATITTNANDGDIIITGTEALQVTAAEGFMVDTAGVIDLESDGVFELDAYSDAHFIVDSGQLLLQTTTSGSIVVDGADGVTLDGNGSNILPATTCQDSLGDASHAFTELWLCNGANIEVAIGGAGGSGAPNTTSGAYVVGTNALNFSTFGPDMTGDTVQAALEAIDGYLTDILTGDIEFDPFTQVKGLDINGAVLNGVVKVSTDAGTPALDFVQNNTSRASWSIPVPADWDGTSDIVVEAVWSPADAGAGDVEWRLEYKALSLTELASSASTNVDYTQAAGGTADAIQTTGVELAIPAASISSSDEIVVINLVRRGSAAGDTYGNIAQMHLLKYSYVAQNIV